MKNFILLLGHNNIIINNRIITLYTIQLTDHTNIIGIWQNI